MKNGFTFQECLDLIEESDNTVLLNEIRSRLDCGEDPGAVLPPYTPGLFRRCLSGFLQFLSFSESLRLSAAIVSEETDVKKETLKQLFYPAVLLIGTFAGIVLFNELCFPPLISMMSGFRLDSSMYETVRKLIRIIVVIIGILGLGTGITLFVFTRPDHIVDGYTAALKVMPSSLPVIYVSLDFVRYFRQCIRMNLSTRQSFGILSTIPGRPLICWLSRAVSSSLLDGEDFVRALDRPELDRTLVRFIRIAVHSSDMEDMLDAYTALTEERIRQRCRRIAGVIQLIAYAMIGVMIILVYRIMLLPLSLMMQI